MLPMKCVCALLLVNYAQPVTNFAFDTAAGKEVINEFLAFKAACVNVINVVYRHKIGLPLVVKSALNKEKTERAS